MQPYVSLSGSANQEGSIAFLRQSSLLNLLTTPVVYSLGFPLLLLDAWTTVYQWLCFPLYGIAIVPRHRYFVIDRHRLPYLNSIEKLNCFYCSYATGLFAYVQEIAARTEQYWCPIQHARPVVSPHQHYQLFLDYGDGTGYRSRLPTLRRALAPPLQTRQEKAHERQHHKDPRTHGLQSAR